MSNIRVFISAVGTLFHWNSINGLEEDMIPESNVIQGIKKLMRKNEDFEFYTLDYYSKENVYEKEEINAFLDKFIPQIPKERRLFVPKGEDREKYMSQGIQSKDVLIGDCTLDLKDWAYKGGVGIQILNGRNNDEEWNGARLDCRLDSLLLAYQLQYFIVSSMQDEYEFERKW